MKFFHFVFLLSFSCICTIFTHAQTKPEQNIDIEKVDRKLLCAIELCRHGDRSPLAQFPADTLPVSKWPEGVGQLTAIGMRAHYNLGRRLRKRYVDTGFLSLSYKQDEIYVRSTDVDRTLMSATSQLSGLYPPGSPTNYDVRVQFGKDPLHDKEGGLPHAFQPIPIHTVEKAFDDLLLVGANCPRHTDLMRKHHQSQEFKQFESENAKFVDKVAKIVKSDKEKFTIWNVEQVSDTWTCFNAHSVPLPDGATPEIVEQAKNISNWLLTYDNRDLEVNRLRAGLILYTTTYLMYSSALKEVGRLRPELEKSVKKFVLLSAHDTTVAATLSALQVFDGKYPPYNSSLIWEIYREGESDMTIRVEYNGKPLIIPGCSSEYCNLRDYYGSIADRMVFGSTARLAECYSGVRRYAGMVTGLFKRTSFGDGKLDLNTFLIDDDASSPVIGSVATTLIVLLVFCAIFFIVRRRSRYRGYISAQEDEKLDAQYGIPGATDLSNSRRILL